MSFKQTILFEALALFEQEGIESISTEDLLATLGISRGTLHEIAANKRELVHRCIIQSIEHKQQAIDILGSKSGSPLTAFLQIMHLSIEEVHSYSPAFVQDLQQHYPWAWARLQLLMRKVAQQHLNPLIKESIRLGHLQPDVPSEMIVRLFLNHLQGLLNPSLLPAYSLNYQELFKIVVVYYLRGCATPLGQEQLEEFAYQLKAV